MCFGTPGSSAKLIGDKYVKNMGRISVTSQLYSGIQVFNSSRMTDLSFSWKGSSPQELFSDSTLQCT